MTPTTMGLAGKTRREGRGSWDEGGEAAACLWLFGCGLMSPDVRVQLDRGHGTTALHDATMPAPWHARTTTERPMKSVSALGVVACGKPLCLIHDLTTTTGPQWLRCTPGSRLESIDRSIRSHRGRLFLRRLLMGLGPPASASSSAALSSSPPGVVRLGERASSIESPRSLAGGTEEEGVGDRV